MKGDTLFVFLLICLARGQEPIPDFPPQYFATLTSCSDYSIALNYGDPKAATRGISMRSHNRHFQCYCEPRELERKLANTPGYLFRDNLETRKTVVE